MAGRGRPGPRPGSGTRTSDGPKSPTATRRQNRTYCTAGLSPVPYSARNASRIVAIASGLVLPKEVAAEMVCSTGSIGVAWLMT